MNSVTSTASYFVPELVIDDPELRSIVENNLREFVSKNRKVKNQNTLRAYESDLQDYLVFCAKNNLVAMSNDWRKTKVAMERFFEHLLLRRNNGKKTELTDQNAKEKNYTADDIAKKRLKRATIKRKISALTFFMSIAEIDNPYHKSKIFRDYIQSSLNKHKPMAQKQATPITLETVCQVEELYDKSNLLELRDLAIVNFGLDTMLRASNIVDVTIEHLDIAEQTVFVPRSKTDQEGKGFEAYISPHTCELLLYWMEAAKINSGPLFRRLSPHKYIVHSEPLSYQGLYRVFKRFGAKLSREGISCHSTRVGSVITQAERNVPLAQIILGGGWKTERMAIRYAEKVNVRKTGMANVR